MDQTSVPAVPPPFKAMSSKHLIESEWPLVPVSSRLISRGTRRPDPAGNCRLAQYYLLGRLSHALSSCVVRTLVLFGAGSLFGGSWEAASCGHQSLEELSC